MGLWLPDGWQKHSASGLREGAWDVRCLGHLLPTPLRPLAVLQAWESRPALAEDPVSSFWESAVLCSFLSQKLVPSGLRLGVWPDSRHSVLSVSQQRQEDRLRRGWKKPSTWPLCALPQL